MEKKALDNKEDFDFVKIEGITIISNTVKNVENNVKTDVKNLIQELFAKIKSNKIKYQREHIVLFHGTSPGAGKTMTSAFLANLLNSPLYRVDLSMVLSKYIGETEKNLENFLNHAESSDAVLFIDEVNFFFSNRRKMKEANNANSKINSLLQKLSAYQGLIILNVDAEIDTSNFFPGRIEIKVNFKITKPEILFKDIIMYFLISMVIIVICVAIGSAIGSSYGGWSGFAGIGIGFVAGLILGFSVFTMLIWKKSKGKI